MGQFLLTILPLFSIIILGFLIRRAGLVTEEWVHVLNKYGLYIAFPAVILHSLYHAGESAAVGKEILLINLVLLTAIIFGVHLIARLCGCSRALGNTYTIVLFFGNIGFLGLPFITALDPQAAGTVSFHIAIYNLLLFTCGIWLLERSREQRASLRVMIKKILLNPLLLAVFAGVLLLITGIKLPEPAVKTIDLLRSSATPVVLLSLGIFLVRKYSWKGEMRHIALLTVLRLAFIPLLFVIAGAVFSPGPGFKVSILEAGMPVAITPFVLGESYPMERHIIATTILVSTLLSAATLMGWWLLIN